MLRRVAIVLVGLSLLVGFVIVPPPAAAQTGFGWGIPENIEFTPEFTDDVDVAMDAQGNAVAVWEQQYGGLTSLWANRRVVGTGWGTAELIETNDTANAFLGGVAMDPQGNAIAAFQQFDGVQTSMWANRFVPGTGWGSPELLENNALGGVLAGPVAMDSNGNAVAIWLQLDGVSLSLWANRFDVTTGWGTPEIIDAGAGNVGSSPDVAMDPSGNAMAVWIQLTAPGVFSVFANRFAVATGWGTAALLETDDASGADGTAVAMDPAGNAVATWRQAGVGVSIWATRFVVGTGWGPPIEIDALVSDAGISPDVAMDAQGNAIAVWGQEDRPFFNTVYANRFVPGAGWGTAQMIEPFPLELGRIELAMNAGGTAIAMWRHFGNTGSIAANRFVPGTGWTGAERIDLFGAGEPFSPQIAMDPAGNAVAAWAVFTGAQGGVMANRFRVDDLPPILTITSPTVALTNNPAVTVGGTTEPGAAVTINGDSVVVDVGGNFARAFVLPDGTHDFLVVATDIEGNANQTIATITVDTVAPLLALASPTSRLTNNPQVTVAGNTEPDATVTVDGAPVTVDPMGAFSLDITLPDGDHALVVVATDAAGNPNSQIADIRVDTVAPSLQLVSPTEGETTEVASIEVAGVTEPDAVLRINGLGIPVAANGTFSVKLGLAEGLNRIDAVATDPAGNSATLTVNLTYTNPVSGLEADLALTLDTLANTQQDLAQTQQSLQETQQGLQEAQQSLQDTQQNLTNVESGIANLGTQVTTLFGLLGASLAAVGALGVLFWYERRRARGTSDSTERTRNQKRGGS